MKNENQDIRQIVDMPEWEGVLDALLSCDPGTLSRSNPHMISRTNGWMSIRP